MSKSERAIELLTPLVQEVVRTAVQTAVQEVFRLLRERPTPQVEKVTPRLALATSPPPPPMPSTPEKVFGVLDTVIDTVWGIHSSLWKKLPHL